MWWLIVVATWALRCVETAVQQNDDNDRLERLMKIGLDLPLLRIDSRAGAGPNGSLGWEGQICQAAAVIGYVTENGTRDGRWASTNWTVALASEIQMMRRIAGGLLSNPMAQLFFVVNFDCRRRSKWCTIEFSVDTDLVVYRVNETHIQSRNPSSTAFTAFEQLVRDSQVLTFVQNLDVESELWRTEVLEQLGQNDQRSTAWVSTTITPNWKIDESGSVRHSIEVWCEVRTVGPWPVFLKWDAEPDAWSFDWDFDPERGNRTSWAMKRVAASTDVRQMRCHMWTVWWAASAPMNYRGTPFPYWTEAEHAPWENDSPWMESKTGTTQMPNTSFHHMDLEGGRDRKDPSSATITWRGLACLVVMLIAGRAAVWPSRGLQPQALWSDVRVWWDE